MYKDKKIIHIVCMDELGGIGKGNKLLFHIPEDLEYFRNKTLGHVCLCGRNTYDSLKKPLTKRVVLNLDGSNYWKDKPNNKSKLKKYYKEVLDYNLGLAKHISNLASTDSIYIIGGASIYNQTADIADELLITIVDAKVEADTYYTIPNGFVKVWESETQHSVNGLSFKLTKWKREDN